MTHSRRDLLTATAGAVGVGALAGCTGRLEAIAGAEELDEGGYAAFFTLYDFASRVGGDSFEFENPVPTGTMGHRYEPGPDLAPRIASHRAFVYMDVDGFQRWAVDAARTIERNHDEVQLVDVLEGIDLLEYDDDTDHRDADGGHHHEDGGHDDGHDSHDHDDGHDSHDHDDDHDDDRGRGDFDPHYWVDPVRAAASVDNIVAGLRAADPDNADAYADNGEAFASRLRELDVRFSHELASRERDVVVVASHDSYQYLADRYDFEIHSPRGVSPHAEPSQEEISETVELIDAEGIDVVLADYFESEDLAEAIVRESSASEIRRLSPAEGTTDEWDSRGWGYVEQMREINLPALKAALGGGE